MKYGYLDGDTPIKYTDNEAWQYIGERWKPIDTADAHFKAKVLTEDTFNKMFGQLPALPQTAFQRR